MNPEIITTVAAALGLFGALWIIMSNFDKRNGDRFTALKRSIEVTRETLRAEFRGEIGLLRGETQAMKADLRLEIREGDRRVSTK
jgi:hypothetical protein